MVYFKDRKANVFCTMATHSSGDVWKVSERLPICGYDIILGREIGETWMADDTTPYVLSWDADVGAARARVVEGLAKTATMFKDAAFKALDMAYEVQHARV